MTARILSGAALALALTTGAAFAQSYNAPAGIPSATAPGGLQGQAGYVNALDAVGQDPRYVAPRGDIATGTVRARRHER